jgi:NAD-dependent DNA ligase
VRQLADAVERAKKQPLSRLLVALSIPHIGVVGGTGREISIHDLRKVTDVKFMLQFASMKLMLLNDDDQTKRKIASEVRQFLNEPAIKLIDDLSALHVNMEQPKIKRAAVDCFLKDGRSHRR